MKFKTVLLAVAFIAIIASSSFICFSAGFKSGFSAAYNGARSDVYAEAWGSGYAAGFNEGNRTGFSQGYDAGRVDGYEEGYRKGVADGAGRGVTLRDPAYSEVEGFVQRDKTDELRFAPEGYTFLDLAAKFKANAMAAGFKCALAIVLLDNGVAALNAFNTTDKGVMFVEPWSDRIFAAKPGDYYGSGKVLKITLIW